MDYPASKPDCSLTLLTSAVRVSSAVCVAVKKGSKSLGFGAKGLGFKA